MYPKKITAVLLVISITLFSHNSIFAAQDPSVVQSIGFFQTTDPYLPFSSDLKKQKGNIGYLLGSIFWKLGEAGYSEGKKGKIKPDYLDYSGISAWNQVESNVILYATGNVGIGTSNPAYKLDVSGSLNATNIYENGTSLASRYQSTISTGTTSQYYRGDKTWQTLNSAAITDATSSNTANMIIKRDASGNFSAGTITANLTGNSSTSTKLQTARTIAGVSFDGTTNISLNTSNITESGSLYFTNSRAQAAITGAASTITTSNLTTSRALISDASGKVGISSVTSTELSYLTGATSNLQNQINTKLGTFGIGIINTIPKYNGIGSLAPSNIVDDGVNVGIGTSSPIDKLDVRGHVSFGNGDGSKIRFEDQGTFNRIAFNEIRFWDWQTGGDMMVLNNGKIGIGTQNPSVALDINSSSSADPLVKMTGNGNIGVFKYANSGNYAYDQVFLGGIFKREFGWTDPAGGFYITRTQSQGNANSDFYINSSGNVGIGTTSPAYKLDVSGDIRATGYFRGDGSQITNVNADTVDGLHATSLFNNMGNNHSTWTDFNSDSGFGFRYMQGPTNGPGISGATQYYNLNLGLGNDYPFSQYAMQFAIPRTPIGGSPYPSMRFKEGGLWGAWSKIFAGYADNAGAVGGVGIGSLHRNDVGGDYQLASSYNGDNSYRASTLELRESNYAGAGVTPPRLGFHWGGVVASQIGIESSGRISILNNPGTGYENLVAKEIQATSGFKFPDGTVQTTAAAGGSTPSGAIIAFYLSTCPIGWIPANGTNGTPDLRGEFIRGLDNGRGVDTGRVLASYQADQMQRITGSSYAMMISSTAHATPSGALSTSSSVSYTGPGSSYGRQYSVVNFDSANSPNARTSSDTTGETRPRNIALLYCMKQ